MLSRKKKNIIKSEVRPEPPLPIHPPAPLHHKDRERNNFSRKSSTASSDPAVSVINKFNSGSEDRRSTSSVSSVSVGRQSTSKNVKSAVGVLQQPSTNTAISGLIPRLGEVLGETDEEIGVRILKSAERQRELKRLLYCLNDWDNINDQNLVKLVLELKENLETFDERMNPIIQQVLSAHWHLRSGKVVRAMEDFLSEMLVVRANFVGVALQALVTKFNPLSFNPSAKCVDIDEFSLTEQKVFSTTHRNLQKVFQMFPMKQSTGVKIMASYYPFMGKDPHVHFCYVSNLLQSIEYLPQAKSEILHLIIHKLSRIDVNISREDIELAAAYYNATTTTVKTEGGGQEIFSMELDSGESFVSNPLIQVVDVCLSLVLEHLKTEFHSGRCDESMLSSLYSVFEMEVLPTFSLNAVQFLFFYLISLDPSHASSFLDLLWKKATTVSAPAVIRIQVMAYMSGILSRATFISITTVKRWLSRFAGWADDYLNTKINSCHWSSVNVEAHGPFYAVCQTIFYVFAFRNKELIGTKHCMAFTRTLHLGRLITSDLNPLKACGNEVAESFVNAAFIHEVSYCRTILERNQLATIPTSCRDSLTNFGSDMTYKGANEQLESFFPFDPILLPRSRVWIDPIYRLYEAYIGDLKIEKEDPYCESEANEDSIDMELGASCPDNSLNSSVDFFCNGVVPFKFKSDVKGESYEMDNFID